jgi:hypothetical protein
MSRVIHAQFVITDYDEDDPLRLEDLRSNINHVLSHARDDIEFYIEGDEGFMRCEPGDCPLCGAPRGEACDGGLHG